MAARRRDRDISAPGLTITQRNNLRAKWIRQGRRCTFCDNPCEQLDHVISLALGGTNYEGNLAPICARCNRRKGDRLIIEWRIGKRLKLVRINAPIATPPRKRNRNPRSPVQLEIKWCSICGALTRRKHCSDECRAEHWRRVLRDRYRAEHGIPVNYNEPSKPWLRLQMVS